MVKPLGITDVVLRDGNQSLLATRLRIEDMLPICSKLDQVGFWSLETWGGATFDACIRFLGEDPWERLRQFKKAMPNTRQQMLLRGQNLLGYRHYADDVLKAFIERAATNGIDVFRIFDALNDARNMKQAIKAAIDTGKHAQGTLSYTVSPVHTMDMWIDLARELEDFGSHSICIKDMAGLLRPYVAEELVSRLKEAVKIPIHMQCHATTGFSTSSILKAVEAGIDNVDTSISSMSMTYGHSPTETVVAIMEGTERDTGMDINLLEEIAAYFRVVRKKYAQFEGSLRGIDSRILVAQVPGGMLTNMENQLREQGAEHRMDEVLEEIPKVRKDLGIIPLVTPTSQIVGTQAVINVISGQRYKTITKESAGILKGEYGKTPAPVNTELQQRVLEGSEPITCRPADLIAPELDSLTSELQNKAQGENISLTKNAVEDVLIYALFGQVGWKFISNRDNPDAFEPLPGSAPAQPATVTAAPAQSSAFESYSVVVNGNSYHVEVGPGGAVTQTPQRSTSQPPTPTSTGASKPVDAPMAGNILKVNVSQGQHIQEGDLVVIMEAMKMETEVRSRHSGTVSEVLVKQGDAVSVGDLLINLT
ncbi:MAG: sodium-extruding oxaloacetate decarboxylase subunit alpha [Gammaproteobacteria bacterium]|nr:sodium-extruding oxaloacetate decarboxylase subunit alpha [Gammaproteobacteria bacterium]